MSRKLYLETTIPSYLAARPSRDLIQSARQELTRTWWNDSRIHYDIYVSPLVIQEATAGDPAAAQIRLNFLAGLPVLDVDDRALALARLILLQVPLPEKAAVDALHIAISVVHGMDYLLTWNCSHIANATFREPIETCCRNAGYRPTIICTPEELP
jgi:predicted nucleic acid-binding protein